MILAILYVILGYLVWDLNKTDADEYVIWQKIKLIMAIVVVIIVYMTFYIIMQ